MKIFLNLIFLLFILNAEVSSQEFIYNKKKDVYFFKPASAKKIDKNIQFYDADVYLYSFCRVSDGKYWGIVDKKGKVVIPLVYDEVKIIRDSMFVVQKDSLWGVINSYEKLIFEIKYDTINAKTMLKAGEGYNGIPKLIIDGKSYIYNIKDKSFKLKENNTEEEIFKVVEDQPILFEECMEFQSRGSGLSKCQKAARQKWIKSRLTKYGIDDLKAIAQFIVRTNGEITDINIVRTENEKYNDRLLELINELEVFRVGMQRQRKVNVLITFPINY